jgi:hypothetical protein
MSDYVAKIFGFGTFGTVYGCMICVSGLTIFSQPALQALVHDVFYEDPGPVNLYLAGAGLIVGVALVMYIDAKAKQIRQKQFEFIVANAASGALADPDDERRSLLSVSLYDTASQASYRAARRRMELRSPRLRPQDGAATGLGAQAPLLGSSYPNMNASLFYSYGTLNGLEHAVANVAAPAADDDATPTATPHGSLRVRRSRQALGAGLRTVTEREEPPDPEQLEVGRKIAEWQERTSKRTQIEPDEHGTVTPSASQSESGTAASHNGDDEGEGEIGDEGLTDGELSRLISLDEGVSETRRQERQQ